MLCKISIKKTQTLEPTHWGTFLRNFSWIDSVVSEEKIFEKLRKKLTSDDGRTDGRRRTQSDDKSSHCLRQGELKKEPMDIRKKRSNNKKHIRNENVEDIKAKTVLSTVIWKIFATVSFLAPLAEGNVSFCHHFASVVVRRPSVVHPTLTFSKIFSSETTERIQLKFLRNVPQCVGSKVCVFLINILHNIAAGTKKRTLGKNHVFF